MVVYPEKQDYTRASQSHSPLLVTVGQFTYIPSHFRSFPSRQEQL